jgi:malonyl-CoA decarboxylase
MNIGRFTKNLFDSIADAGENFLNLKRLRGTSTQKLISLCNDLISHKGLASGLALARQIVNRYHELTNQEKLIFFTELNKATGPRLEEIKAAAQQFADEPNEDWLHLLSEKIKTNRSKLFSRMIMAPGGAKTIVSLRADLLDLLPAHPDLKPMDQELRSLLRSWFNPGFLILKRIDWNTEAAILEKIIEYEAVHDIENWIDLKRRLVENRRCFAYFHPSLEEEPLIFVEVALTKGISKSIQSIFNNNDDKNIQADTAIFYSINNCQKGLRGIPLGNFLIKIVVMQLAHDLPSVKTYSTLSPVPGFSKWLAEELQAGKSDFLDSGDLKTLKLTGDDDWHKDAAKLKALQKPLLKACASYLVVAKRNNKPLDPVAKFHFGNGAQLYRINWMGNASEYGLRESCGIMVNYLYDLRQIESNHEAYVQKGELSVSKNVKGLLG